MKKTSIVLTALSLVLGSTLHMHAVAHPNQAPFQIPEIDAPASTLDGYEKISDVAQYGGADWNNVVGISRHVSLQQAKQIADNNPSITYFFYTNGWEMHLESKGSFHMGDAVFFAGTPWWGSAPGFADGYVKQVQTH